MLCYPHPEFWKFTFRICLCETLDGTKSMVLLCWRRTGAWTYGCSCFSFWENQKLKPAPWKCTAHTWPKWTVIGLRSSRSLGSLASSSVDGRVFGRDSSAEETQPFSAMSCREKKGLGLALGSWTFVLLPHPHKPWGLLRTPSRVSKPDPWERWRK